MIRKLTALAVSLAVMAGCSLDAPPPTAPSTSTGNQSVTQQAGNTGGSEQTVGVAPSPSVVSEDSAVSPGSPINFAALTPVPMALVWYGRTDLNEIPVTVSKAGTASRIDFTILNLGIDCKGLVRFDGSEGYGDWELICSDSSEAAGILVPVAGQASINGQGVDRTNHSVLFSIPLTN